MPESYIDEFVSGGIKEKLKDDFFLKCPKTATGEWGWTVDSLNYMIHGRSYFNLK